MIACDFTRAPRELLCGVLLLVPPPPPLGFLHPPTHPCVLCEALSDLSCRSPGGLSSSACWCSARAREACARSLARVLGRLVFPACYTRYD